MTAFYGGWAPGMGASICFDAEIGPPNLGLPPSFPSILGKKGENVNIFVGSVFFQHASETRTFFGAGSGIIAPAIRFVGFQVPSGGLSTACEI